MKAKALSPIIATILLVVIAVILVSVILSFGQDFATKGLDQTKDVKDLSKSDAEHFIYPKTFSDGIIQFSYSPPNNFGDINITKYKILYDNNETTEIELDTPHTLKAGTNLINLNDFTDQNVTSRKFTLVLETTDNKCITLKNITNPYPYVEPEPEELIPLDVSIYSPTDSNVWSGEGGEVNYILNSYKDFNATITGGTGEYSCSWNLKRYDTCGSLTEDHGIISTNCSFNMQLTNQCTYYYYELTVSSPGFEDVIDGIYFFVVLQSRPCIFCPQ